MEMLLTRLLPVALLAVALSDTVGGMLSRITFAFLLHFFGAIDLETADRIVAFTAF